MRNGTLAFCCSHDEDQCSNVELPAAAERPRKVSIEALAKVHLGKICHIIWEIRRA